MVTCVVDLHANPKFRWVLQVAQGIPHSQFHFEATLEHMQVLQAILPQFALLIKEMPETSFLV